MERVVLNGLIPSENQLYHQTSSIKHQSDLRLDAGESALQDDLILRFFLRTVGAGFMPGACAMAPVPAIAENALHDKVIGRRTGSNADAEVDLPLGGDVQVGYREDLLLLIVQAGGRAEPAIVGVVFDARVHLLGNVVADLGARRKVQAVSHAGTVPGALQRRVDGEVPAANSLVDDGPNLPGPRVRR